MPVALATSRCPPGTITRGAANAALRVVVAPDAVTYTSSRPFASASTELAFAISTYSSEAEAPPVTTSATTNPLDGGQAATAAANPGGWAAAMEADATMNDTSRTKTPRGAGIRHLRRPFRRE
jgi:hypothetical protein